MFAQHLSECIVEQVGGSVVTRDSHASFFIDCGFKQRIHIGRQFFYDVHRQIVFSLRGGDLHHFSIGSERTLIAHLTAHFGVERRA